MSLGSLNTLADGQAPRIWNNLKLGLFTRRVSIPSLMGRLLGYIGEHADSKEEQKVSIPSLMGRLLGSTNHATSDVLT